MGPQGRAGIYRPALGVHTPVALHAGWLPACGRSSVPSVQDPDRSKRSIENLVRGVASYFGPGGVADGVPSEDILRPPWEMSEFLAGNKNANEIEKTLCADKKGCG